MVQKGPHDLDLIHALSSFLDSRQLCLVRRSGGGVSINEIEAVSVQDVYPWRSCARVKQILARQLFSHEEVGVERNLTHSDLIIKEAPQIIYSRGSSDICHRPQSLKRHGNEISETGQRHLHGSCARNISSF